MATRTGKRTLAAAVIALVAGAVLALGDHLPGDSASQPTPSGSASNQYFVNPCLTWAGASALATKVSPDNHTQVSWRYRGELTTEGMRNIHVGVIRKGDPNSYAWCVEARARNKAPNGHTVWLPYDPGKDGDVVIGVKSTTHEWTRFTAAIEVKLPTGEEFMLEKRGVGAVSCTLNAATLIVRACA